MQDKTNRAFLWGAGVATMLLSTIAPAAHAQITWGGGPVSAKVILKMTGPVTPTQQARLNALGASTYRALPFIHSLAVSVPTKNLQKLAALPFVAHLSSDMAVKKSDEFTVGSSGADMAFQQYALTGKGVTVAVLDSGVQASAQDLQKPQSGTVLATLLGETSGGSRVLANVSFALDPKSGGKLSPDDQCGHGTHVAGIIAGNGAASSAKDCFRTFKGIAPNANLLNVRVLDANGGSTVSTVLAGLQWVAANKVKYNIRVVNLSLGHPVNESYTTDPLCQAVEALWKAGVVVVCAAGNQGRGQDLANPSLNNEGYGANYGSIQSPGNDPYVITVGAAKSVDGKRADDKIATYSSRGPSRLDLVLKPDIIAPGNKVISLAVAKSALDTYAGGTNTIPLSVYVTKGNLISASKQYFRLSGTSMASPVVAGAAALLLQKYPTLTPDTIKARLMVSADKMTDAQGNPDPLTYGAGYLNIPAALASTVAPTQPAFSPRLTQDRFGVVMLSDSNAIWGNHAIWGNGLWGTGIADLNAVWGSHAIWGNAVVVGSHALWGNCAVWSDHAIWGNTTDRVDLTSTAIRGE